MTSRYDPHAALIEELFAAGESFTGIARQLEQKHAIPLDASGLRRWLLRRLSKREARAPLLDPTIAAKATAIQQAQAISSIKKENRTPDKNSTKDIATKPEEEKSEFSMKEIIAEAEAGIHKPLLKK